jgi:hypothetical protein
VPVEDDEYEEDGEVRQEREDVRGVPERIDTTTI